ncbi:MAG: hypothetical protein J6J39_02155 [Clostridia bacterium]|nr:hypothetical protein [Clostridia bacterium]
MTIICNMLKSNVKLKCFSFVGIFSLLLGALIYLIFRKETIFSEFFSNSQVVCYLQGLVKNFKCDFIRYYLADFLWALSLSCGLHIVFNPQMRGSFACSVIVVLFGASYEFLQYKKIINGTGDLADVCLYLLATITVNIINLKVRERNEKNY